MTDDRWIVIPNWPRFQHYGNRNPTWIKVYLELLHHHEWRRLSFADRGVLLTAWIAYAGAHGVLHVSRMYASCDAKSNAYGNVDKSLKRLEQAGFVKLVASKPLALRYRNTRSREGLSTKDQESASARASDERGASAPEEDDYSLDPDVLAESERAELEQHIPDALQRRQPPGELGERDPQALERLRQLMADIGS